MRPSGTAIRSALGTQVPSSPGKYILTPANRSRKAYTPNNVPRLKHGCQIASPGKAAVALTSATSSSLPKMRRTLVAALMTYPSRSSGTGSPPNTIAVLPSVLFPTTGNASPNTPFKKKFSSSAASRVAYAAFADTTISEQRSMTTSAFAAIPAAKNAKSAKRILRAEDITNSRTSANQAAKGECRSAWSNRLCPATPSAVCKAGGRKSPFSFRFRWHSSGSCWIPLKFPLD